MAMDNPVLSIMAGLPIMAAPATMEPEQTTVIIFTAFCLVNYTQGFL